LLYGNLIINENNIIIPDPDIYTRSFIAIPLAEINPLIILPDTGKNISDIIKKFQKDKMIPDIKYTESLRRLFI